MFLLSSYIFMGTMHGNHKVSNYLSTAELSERENAAGLVFKLHFFVVFFFKLLFSYSYV